MNDLPLNLEADLLALIEGQPLSASQRAAIDAALAADPALAALIRSGALQADREQLRTLGDVRAPADMLSRVETMLEREALLSLSAAELASAPDQSLPISRVQPQGRSVWSIVTHSQWARPLAAAAGIALVAGISLMIFSQRTQPTGPALGGRTVATSEAANPKPLAAGELSVPRSETELDARSRSTARESKPIAGAMAERTDFFARRSDLGAAATESPLTEPLSDKTIAAAPPSPAMSVAPEARAASGPGGGSSSRAMDATTMAVPDPMTQNQSGSIGRAFQDTAGDRDDGDGTTSRKQDEFKKDVASKEQLDAKAAELTSEDALQLAAAGRLAIRVIAPTTDDGLRTVRSVHTKVARVTPAEDLPADQFARLLAVTNEAPSKRLVDLDTPAATTPASKLLDAVSAGAAKPAGDTALAPPISQPVPQPTTPILAKPAAPSLNSASTLSLRLPADADSIASLLRSLRSASTSAQFVELRAPVGMGVQVMPIDVSEIVWWTQPPAAWTPRVQIPVIVEQKP